MKNIILISVFFLYVLTPIDAQVNLKLGSGFMNDYVEVTLLGDNGNLILFSDTVMTSLITGLGHSVKVIKCKKYKYITVVVNKNINITYPCEFFRRKNYYVLDVIIDEKVRWLLKDVHLKVFNQKFRY